ncbi:hypothetical protein B0O99DRAFT_688826 [Bisporella sp. PMI_857]|nr:hypothetical protein B0O99DRAFT_688826 [Bisporella sp. PMI_857]
MEEIKIEPQDDQPCDIMYMSEPEDDFEKNHTVPGLGSGSLNWPQENFQGWPENDKSMCSLVRDLSRKTHDLITYQADIVDISRDYLSLTGKLRRVRRELKAAMLLRDAALTQVTAANGRIEKRRSARAQRRLRRSNPRV